MTENHKAGSELLLGYHPKQMAGGEHALFGPWEGQRRFASLKELLAQSTLKHDSTAELSNALTLRVHDILREWLEAEGVKISKLAAPEVITEPSLDRARSHLPALMASAKENLVATISKNDKVDNAVALIDWRALEILCLIARRTLDSTHKFSEFAAMDEFSSSDAKQLTSIELHKPLPYRQSVAERREALRTLSVQNEESPAEAEETKTYRTISEGY